jgi:5-methylcytosine-specific restriction protein A
MMCSVGHRYRGKRCPICSSSRARASTSERGYGARWQRLARTAIALQPWCTNCGATEDLTADHAYPSKRTGLTLGDVDVLCRSCNAAKGTRVF